MAQGPVELVVLTFTGDSVGAGVADAFAEVVARGDVNVLDLVFIAKDEIGDVRIVEADESDDAFGLADLDPDGHRLVNDEDLGLVAEDLEPGTSAAFVVVEHRWARQLSSAVAEAGGEVVLHVRIPVDTVDEVMAAIA